MSDLLFSDAEGTGHPADVARTRNEAIAVQAAIDHVDNPRPDPYSPGWIQLTGMLRSALSTRQRAAQVAEEARRRGLDALAVDLEDATQRMHERAAELAQMVVDWIDSETDPAHPTPYGH